MIKKEELIQRSPIRIFEQSTGGLKSGEIGVIASLRGIGKTSVLVQIALDKLLQGKKVIHVSFSQTQYVLAWYDDIFNEFINKKNLENADDVKNDLVQNRVLMSFNQGGMTKEQIVKSLRALITAGGFAAEAVIIDGFDFSRADQEQSLQTSLAGVKDFAKELDLSVWYSCTVKDSEPSGKQNVPAALKGVADLIDIVITLDPKPDHIDLSVSKCRDSADEKPMSMRLDPKTLLIR